MPLTRILIIDDEEDACRLLVRFLERTYHCTADRAADGAEALEMLKGGSYDAAIVDIKMPGLSGIDVIRKAQELSPATKFLALSGYDSEEIAHQAVKAGAVDFLTKPQKAEIIAAKLASIVTQLQQK